MYLVYLYLHWPSQYSSLNSQKSVYFWARFATWLTAMASMRRVGVSAETLHNWWTLSTEYLLTSAKASQVRPSSTFRINQVERLPYEIYIINIKWFKRCQAAIGLTFQMALTCRMQRLQSKLLSRLLSTMWYFLKQVIYRYLGIWRVPYGISKHSKRHMQK